MEFVAPAQTSAQVMRSASSGSSDPVRPPESGPGVVRLPGLWLWLSLAAALLAAVGNGAGLLWPESIYNNETAALADAATAQDVVGLLPVTPLLVALGVWASRGSLWAHLG